MVKSEATHHLTDVELMEIQENLKKSDEEELRRFRLSFDPDEMGFYGKKEGI